jgi:hypothetical protein
VLGDVVAPDDPARMLTSCHSVPTEFGMSTETQEVGSIDMKLEVVTLPVSDVDKENASTKASDGDWTPRSLLASPYRTVIMAVEDGNCLVTVACPGGLPLTGDQFSELASTPVSPTVAGYWLSARGSHSRSRAASRMSPRRISSGRLSGFFLSPVWTMLDASSGLCSSACG